MIIQHKAGDAHGVFFISQEDYILAELVYSLRNAQQMIIEHTEVDEELRGQDIGYELVHKAVEFARLHGYSIMVVCPFAQSVFDKRPDFRDVLV